MNENLQRRLETLSLLVLKTVEPYESSVKSVTFCVVAALLLQSRYMATKRRTVLFLFCLNLSADAFICCIN